MALVAQTRARIFGTANSWSLTAHAGYAPEGRECGVNLKIAGDAKNGYHLVISPDGFFTADNWYQTLDEALASALELFDVAADNWWKESTAQDSPNTLLERARGK